MFAVVDDQQGRRRLQPFDERALAARDAERGDGGVDDFGVRVRTLESHEPHAAGLRDESTDRQRERGLADTTRSDDLDQSMLTDELGERSGLRVAADQPRREGRQVAVPRSDVTCARRTVEPFVVGEDLSFELSEVSAGLESELVGERRPNPLVRGERVGLASGLIQARDQQRPKAFLIRMVGDDQFEIGDHLARPAHAQPGRAPSRAAAAAPPPAAPGAAPPTTLGRR